MTHTPNSKPLLALIAPLALGGLAGIAGATQPAAEPEANAQPAFKYPAFKPLRFEEDWSDFDPDQGSDFWDPIKRMKLNADGSSWLSMGGELRLRAEHWESFGFSPASTADDTFILARAQLHTDWHFGDHIRVFIEGESAIASDRDLPGGRRGLDVDELDLQNAFVDVMFPLGDSDSKLTLRVGRQGLLFGKQRLVSPLPWANSQRSWDGGRVILETHGWRVDAFYTRYTPVKKYQFNDWMAGPDFWGVYATGKVGPDDNIGLDLYYLGLDTSGPVTFNGSMGAEDRHTIGARLFGAFGDSGFKYDVEGAYQFGDVGSADINAFMLASQLSYTYADSSWKPSVYIGADYASGDDAPGDGDVETFNQLFPLGHAYNGYMDLIGRQNIIDLSAGFSFKPHEKVLIKADFHHFIRASDADSVYNAGGGVLRATALGASDEVGQEIDVTLKYIVDRHLTLQGGYSHFFAGDYFSDTGLSEDIDFFYFQVVYKF